MKQTSFWKAWHETFIFRPGTVAALALSILDKGPATPVGHIIRKAVRDAAMKMCEE